MCLPFRSFGGNLTFVIQESKSDIDSAKDKNKAVELATAVVGFGGFEVHRPLALPPLRHSDHAWYSRWMTLLSANLSRQEVTALRSQRR